MPRDLAAIAKEDTLQGMSQLNREAEITKSPEEVEGHTGSIGATDPEEEDAMFRALAQRNEKRDELHPYTQSLNLSDVESCVRLEEETFPPNERCTREKVSARSMKMRT